MSDNEFFARVDVDWCKEHLEKIECKLAQPLNLNSEMIKDLRESLHKARCALEHADQRIVAFSGPMTRRRKKRVDEWMNFKQQLGHYN